MKTDRWQPVEIPQSAQFADARRQAHNAVHWLARIANSYVASEENSNGGTIKWDDQASTLRTKSFSENVNVELRLAGLELQFCENGLPVPHTLSFEERTPAHVEAWILVELLHRGIERTHFSKDLPYPATDLMLGDSEEHAPENYVEELTLLDSWFRNGATICRALQHDLQNDSGSSITDSPLVLWPQTFQLGVEIPLPPGSGASALRAGVSAGDNLRPEPFFFVGTTAQTISLDFDADSILSSRRIQEEKLSSDDVKSFMVNTVTAHRKRLAG